jgi:hypothetical protein
MATQQAFAAAADCIDAKAMLARAWTVQPIRRSRIKALVSRCWLVDAAGAMSAAWWLR